MYEAHLSKLLLRAVKPNSCHLILATFAASTAANTSSGEKFLYLAIT